ncbi:M23 family metallopeptidase [Kribbella sp. NPDC023855]|uniref:M23 family metallopeptidase n=1 Tax=Kribbella sp. NPDC023855 TaxID=3154698 RepID=UPI003406BB68
MSEAGRTAPRRTPAGARRVAKHRLTRRSSVRGVQLVGLTAALAAAAGTSAVALSPTAGPATAGTASTTTSSQQLDAITAARIERRELATRDMSRFELSLESTRKAQAAAAAAAKARAAKLAANANLTQRRAAALAAAKQLAARKAAAAAKAEAIAKAKAAAKAEAIAKAKAAPKVVLPTTGYRITATFGQAGGRWARNHTGLDFAAPIGTPVRSVMAGEVIQADYEGAYGRQVKVRHADGTVTSYSHMSEFTVSVGDSVQAGSQVGSIGVTGNTTGPHLHFEVLPGGDGPINPKPWLIEHGVNP